MTELCQVSRPVHCRNVAKRSGGDDTARWCTWSTLGGLALAGTSALEQFPLLIAALKAELREELLEDLAAGKWLDQEQSVLGRNTHIKACKRLIRKASPHAYYDASDGRWLIRASAVDQEIVRRNRALVEAGKIPETIPPPPAPSVVKATLRPEELADLEDETAIYTREWLRKLGGES